MPFISLTTDFGHAYTATCAGVIYTITPGATVLTLSDEVPAYGIVEGAMLLRHALPYLPEGVHVGIVDPGVGTARRPIAMVTGRGDVLVGPDNGLLVPAAEKLGGPVRAHAIENPSYRLPGVSASFHGRDVFAPAAAHIAKGTDLADLGPEITDPLPLDLPEPAIGNGELRAPILYVDRFGSLILNATTADLEAALGPTPHGTQLSVDGAPVPYAATYGMVPKNHPLVWEDSSGLLGVAVNQGSAAKRFGLGGGDVVTLRRAQ
ncbi:S-adenosyl-l-methionine hydroxide adenosyltransferase family protein [Actinomadura sp. SCN-SB]|uniref:SAM hydrolase/SAM-dependent halogenase family protein n=1 Tax=Actinomadura sp. SCN-SB TaxID=3373092 RepID=UPI003750BD66